MPHFGLMDENLMPPEEAELLRLRLHVRAGRRLIGEGRLRDGMSALFDALMSSLRWYDLTHGRPAGDLVDEREIFGRLKNSGVIEGSFDYDGAYEAVEGLIDGGTDDVDHAALAAGIESVMEELGAIPFDYSVLPPERPAIER